MSELNIPSDRKVRYFIRLSFDGSPFHGWQIQQNANSVQAELNKALELILKQKEIETLGCGRTDTGVHALKFYAHFDHYQINNLSDLVHQLNAILPHAIAIHSIFPVDQTNHARFSATSRTYVYRVYNKKNPFLKNWSCFYPGEPDLEKMNFLAEKLKSHSNFSCFAKSNTQTLTNICVITFAEWKREGEELIFKITADRFLRNMVRAIVGTLLNVGMNKIGEKEFLEILESRDRSEAGFSVPANGLYLTEVVYPFPVY